EEVPRQPRLPVLVLRSDRPAPKLELRLGEAGDVAATVLVERALVRVTIDAAGAQEYRARFRLVRLFRRTLDVELPGPLPGLCLKVKLDGRQVDPEAVDDSGRRSPTGRVARLRLGPELVRRGSVLEREYRRAGGGGRGSDTPRPPPAA